MVSGYRDSGAMERGTLSDAEVVGGCSLVCAGDDGAGGSVGFDESLEFPADSPSRLARNSLSSASAISSRVILGFAGGCDV